MALDQLEQGAFEFLFTAKNYIHLLQIGGKRETVELRPRGQGTANIPGVNGAADGAMDQMKGIGNGIKHHPGAAENAGTLADGAG
jgi:hypothetical protein